MKKQRVLELFAIAAQLTMLPAAPALKVAQSAPAPSVQPSGPSNVQRDPYAAAFAGLTYTAGQKAAIDKIRQDIASRKSAVVNDAKLSDDQKGAMLTGYTRIEYGLIFKELTPEQKKQVSTRMQALRAADQAAKKAPKQ